jgi:hypothetical protein
LDISPIFHCQSSGLKERAQDQLVLTIAIVPSLSCPFVIAGDSLRSKIWSCASSAPETRASSAPKTWASSAPLLVFGFFLFWVFFFFFLLFFFAASDKLPLQWY